MSQQTRDSVFLLALAAATIIGILSQSAPLMVSTFVYLLRFLCC